MQGTRFSFSILSVHACISNLGTTGWMHNKCLEKPGSKIIYFQAPCLCERCCLQKQLLLLRSPEIHYCCAPDLPSDPFYPPCSEESLFWFREAPGCQATSSCDKFKFIMDIILIYPSTFVLPVNNSSKTF